MPNANDYKILADLLYPTIESTGNEYYGQTKKIALSNYFDSSAPFESYLDSTKVGNAIQCYFKWKLGPLSDSVKTYTSVNDGGGTYSTFPDINKIVYIYDDLEHYVNEIIKDTANNINFERLLYGASFLKYNVIITKNDTTHETASGIFSTYDYDVSLQLDSLIVNNNLNPITNEDISDTISDFNFIFDDTTSTLYVKVCNGFVANKPVVENQQEENLDDSQCLVLKAVGGDVNIRYTYNTGEDEYPTTPEYMYSVDDDTWEILDSSTGVNVTDGNYILLKCTDRSQYNIPYLFKNETYQEDEEENPDEEQEPEIEYKVGYDLDSGGWVRVSDWSEQNEYTFDGSLIYTNLILTKLDQDSNATVEAYGNISSMIPDDSAPNAPYANLFKGCDILTRAPLLPDTALSGFHYYQTFYGCSQLLKPPALPATVLAESCYENMFAYCVTMIKAPDLTSTSLYGNSKCYERMFYGCSSLSEITIGLPNNSLDENYSKNWMTGVSTNGVYHLYQPQPINSSSINYGIPSTWIDDSFCAPLTFVSDGDTGIRLTFNNSNQYKYKKNDSEWASYTSGVLIPVSEDDRLSFERDTLSDYHSNTASNNAIFSSSGGANVYAYGNCMSMVNANIMQSDSGRSLEYIYDYNGAETTHHYTKLFYEFAKLRKAPTLYENFLAESCYDNMFYGCTGLETAPIISATKLAQSCCSQMFSGCSSLVNAPTLTATSLANQCYYKMFSDCTSLENAPELPATILSPLCYYSMFSDCTSLKKSPTLLAPKLTGSCYANMFAGCSSLDYVVCKATDITSSDLSSWLYNTANDSIGALVANIRLDWQNNGDLPSNWYLYERYYNCNKESSSIITSGSNSDYNGRGDIYNNSTLYNMEPYSAVANVVNSADTYNELDGSATQEIWGYKCFNSPVMFKNGLYGTCASLLSYIGEDLTVGYRDNFWQVFSSISWVNDTLSGSTLACNIGKYSPINASPQASVNVYYQSAKPSGSNSISAVASTAELVSDYHADDASNRSARVFVRSIKATNSPSKGFYNVAKLQAGGVYIKAVDSTISNTSTKKIYTKGRIEPDPDWSSNDQYIGAEDNKYKHVYAENLHGCIPYAYLDSNYNAVYPLGSLLVVKFDVADIPFGTVLTYNNGSWKKGNGDIVSVFPSSLDGNYYENQQITDMGNGAKIVTISINHSNKPVLVMRIK